MKQKKKLKSKALNRKAEPIAKAKALQKPAASKNTVSQNHRKDVANQLQELKERASGQKKANKKPLVLSFTASLLDKPSKPVGNELKDYDAMMGINNEAVRVSVPVVAAASAANNAFSSLYVDSDDDEPKPLFLKKSLLG